MSGSKIKTVILVLVLLIVCAVIYLPGYTKYQELKGRTRELKAEIARIKALNIELQDMTERLQTDVAYLEEVIRKDLGLAKPGEVVYKIKRAPKEESK